MNFHHPAMRQMACAYSSDPVRDAGRFMDAQTVHSDAMHAEEDRLHAETLALGRIGQYERLLDAMDYRNNDQIAMRALVLCANKGNVEARDALNTLARTWAELHAEVD